MKQKFLIEPAENFVQAEIEADYLGRPTVQCKRFEFNKSRAQFFGSSKSPARLNCVALKVQLFAKIELKSFDRLMWSRMII